MLNFQPSSHPSSTMNSSSLRICEGAPQNPFGFGRDAGHRTMPAVHSRYFSLQPTAVVEEDEPSIRLDDFG